MARCSWNYTSNERTQGYQFWNVTCILKRFLLQGRRRVFPTGSPRILFLIMSFHSCSVVWNMILFLFITAINARWKRLSADHNIMSLCSNGMYDKGKLSLIQNSTISSIHFHLKCKKSMAIFLSFFPSLLWASGLILTYNLGCVNSNE